MTSALVQASCVAIEGRALLIEGAPRSGKSNLALALIDRGAVLIGDDGVQLEAKDGRLYASPPPNIAGLLEVRNLGLLSFPITAHVHVALAVRLDAAAERFIDSPDSIVLCSVDLPLIRLWPDTPLLAVKAELALRTYGLS